MGPGDLSKLLEPLSGLADPEGRVLVGPGTSDDAGVFAWGGGALVATADFITPVCDDPCRFGRVAAANALSDVFAMGGSALFALNLCCFPEDRAPREALAAILAGAAETVQEAGGVVLGGHTVSDPELKFGLAVVGEADPERLLTNAGARPGQRLILTKPLGTGVLINAFKCGKLDEAGLEPALAEMERLNARAAELALAGGATASTDVTGFGLVGHALEMAQASGAGLRVEVGRLPVHPGFAEMVGKGVTTASTGPNRAGAAGRFRSSSGRRPRELEVLFDPQTSGGLLLAVDRERAEALLAALVASGHRAADIGEVVAGPPVFQAV